jgi:hypothetical protein
MKINVTASFNQLLVTEMPFLGRHVEPCGPIFHLKVTVAASFNQVLRVGRMRLVTHTPRVEIRRRNQRRSPLTPLMHLWKPFLQDLGQVALRPLC